MNLELDGRTALVTGGSAGIGTGVAEVLAHEGARVAIAGRNRAALELEADRIAGLTQRRPVVVVGELATAGGPEALAAAAQSALGGRIDILVNNAGGSRPFKGTASDAFWNEAMALNFTAPRKLAEALIPGMCEARWGRVINVTGAIFGKSTNAAGAAKAGLLAWSRAQAFELAPHGITVNCVAPGRIESVQIMERLHPTEESRQAFIRENIPMGHFGKPRDMGNVVAFLASPLADYISGVHLPVDGGAVRITM